MTDPLSITVGVLALVKVTTQVSFLVKQFCDEVSIVDATLAGVLNEVEGFQQVLESMKETFEQDGIKANLQATGHVGTHWKNLARALEDGTTTLQQLYTLLETINKTTSVLDKPRRQLRLKNAAEQISVYREQIKSYRAALQLSLSTVILWNQVTFQKSTEGIPDKILPTLDKLYDEFRSFGALLNAKIEKLESTVTTQSDESDNELKKMSNLRECVRSAADVVSTASSTLTAEISDKVSVRNGSDFGDIFVKGNNETMLRWMSSNTVYEFDEMESPVPDPSEASTAAATEYQSDSDSDIENEMIRVLFDDGKKRKEKGDFPTAARLFRNCLARFSSNTSHASLTSAQSVSTCGFSKVELLELLTDTYSSMECWSEAKLTILEKLSITERQVGKKDQLYLWDTLHLARYLMKTNEFVEAHLQGRRSLRGFKKLGEPGYEGYESCLKFLCDLCKMEAKIDEEEAYLALLGNHQRKVKGSSSHAAPPSTVNSGTERLPEKTPVAALPIPKIPENDTALKKEVSQLQDPTENTSQGAQDSIATSQKALPDIPETTNSEKDKSVGPNMNPPPGKLLEDKEADRNTPPVQHMWRSERWEKQAVPPQHKNTPSLEDKTATSEKRISESAPSVEGSKISGQSSPPITIIPSKPVSSENRAKEVSALPREGLYTPPERRPLGDVPPFAFGLTQILRYFAIESSQKKGSNIRRTDLTFLKNYCKYFHLAPPKIVSGINRRGWKARATIPGKRSCLVDDCSTEETAMDAVVAKACFTHITAIDQEHVISSFEKRDPYSDKEVYEPLFRQVVAHKETAPSELGDYKPGCYQECPVCADILPKLSEEQFSSHVNGCTDRGRFAAQDTKPEFATTVEAMNTLESARGDLPDSSTSEVRELSSPRVQYNPSASADGTWACDSCELKTIQFLTHDDCQGCGRGRTSHCPSSLNNFRHSSGVYYQSAPHSLKAITEFRFGVMTAERKVLLLGDTYCGKTFLASAWVDGKPFRRDVDLFNQFEKGVMLKDYRMFLKIWDPPGEGVCFPAMLRGKVIPDMHLLLMCFDIATEDSLDNIEHGWNLEAQYYFPNVPKILVGCQRDRRSDEAVRSSLQYGGEMPLSPYAGIEMAKKIKALAYWETSAEAGEAVDELFNYIVEAPIAAASTSSKGKFAGLRKFWSKD